MKNTNSSEYSVHPSLYLNLWSRLEMMVSHLILLSLASTVLGLDVTSRFNNRTKYVELGKDFTLGCDYELDEGEQLHSLKWYRNEQEFYTFQPSQQPKVRLYELAGLNVDNVGSRQNSLIVRNVSLLSGGTFKCEVSCGPPRYETATIVVPMEVVDYPERPVISGEKTWYMLGDEVFAHCWSGEASPKPTIKWWINDGESVNPSYLSTDNDNTGSQLRFVITEKHLIGGRLTVKCTVEVFDDRGDAGGDKSADSRNVPLALYFASSKVEAHISQVSLLTKVAHLSSDSNTPEIPWVLILVSTLLWNLV